MVVMEELNTIGYVKNTIEKNHEYIKKEGY
jgi:hypothetical protein